MNDSMVADRFKALRDLFDRLKTEILEVKEGLDLLKELKTKFDGRKYSRLKQFVNAKGWFAEVIEELEDYYDELEEKIARKFERADKEVKAKLYFIAKTKLPPDRAKRFLFDVEVDLSLNAKALAKLVKVDRKMFKVAKEAYEKGESKIVFNGELALKYLALKGEK